MDNYKFIFIPFLGLFFSQTIKFILESLKNKKICFDRLLNGSGGMPSTHSCFVTSLTTLIYLECGLESIYFSVSLIFSLIVIYDSMGVRYEAGKQAKVLNDVIKQMKFKNKFKLLKEKIGHKPIEVLCGCLLGISIAFIFG